MNYFGWAHEHQSGKAAQTLWLSFRQLRGLVVGCVGILHVFCSHPTSLLGADCLDALWKVGRADKVLLWNKCSRLQGLQLEKASGEAALGEVFTWFQWEGAVKERVFVRSGETWAQSRGEGKAWPQSCLCFSESKNWECLKAHVRPRLSQGEAGAGKPSLFPQATVCKIPGRIPVLVRPVRTNATVSADRDQWSSLGCSSWRMVMKTKENGLVFHFFIPDSAGFDLTPT